jgi:hypothetical protein
MFQTTQSQFRQTSEISSENREVLVELSKSKAKLRKVEEFIRKYETFTDVRGFMAGQIIQILEDKDA